MELRGLIESELHNSAVFYDEPMSAHTSFRIGGKADIFIDGGAEDILPLVSFCRKNNIPLTVLGNGSNVLVGDKGIRGITLSLGKNSSEISCLGNDISAGAGTLLSVLSKRALELGLTGLEFAFGIPGSLGGALCMNAGAYGGEIKDVISSVLALNLKSLKEERFYPKDLDFSYRHSVFSLGDFIVLSGTLSLCPGDKDEIKNRMAELKVKRNEKQPVEFPSAGSTFKRPEGFFAGGLIEEAGLKGLTIGGAQVSKKHAGFIINLGNATARDVRNLIETVQERVFEFSGVSLEPEVRFVGEF